MNESNRADPVPVEGESSVLRLRRIIEQYLDFMGRILRSYGVLESDVDDGVQQVCLVLADKIDRVEPNAERSFVFRTSQRIASRIRRTRSRRNEVGEEAAANTVDALDPEKIADERQAFDVLAQLLDGLEDDLRDVFILFELEELTMAAIAEMLQIPPGTVASRLRRAREQFQARIHAMRYAEERRA
jgi:RNA polymerase sigma-70 factor (ECF subfamily)